MPPRRSNMVALGAFLAVSAATVAQNALQIVGAIRRTGGGVAKYVEAFSRPIPYTVASADPLHRAESPILCCAPAPPYPCATVALRRRQWCRALNPDRFPTPCGIAHPLIWTVAPTLGLHPHCSLAVRRRPSRAKTVGALLCSGCRAVKKGWP